MLTKPDQSATDVATLMQAVGRRARAAARPLALASPDRKHAALIGMAEAISRATDTILAANDIDVAEAEVAGLAPSFVDRLRLDKGRVRAMADGVRAIAELKDPVGEVIAEWDRPNGLHIERVRTPLGVIGVIYESRPNVTADAGALCLKAGNPVILRGGSDSANSSRAIHACMVEGLKSAGLPADAIQLVPVTDRAAVGAMLSGLDGNIDVIVPRGGKSLVARVQAEARVPVFAHLEGIVHVYVDKSADPDMARKVVLNAKMRRTGICGAAECLLIDWKFYTAHGAPMIADLLDAGCEVRAEGELQKVSGTVKAEPGDFGHEFLDKVIAARLVDGIGEAIAHIEKYSSHHTEAIIAEDPAAVERFFAEVDSAILLHNASTQFADGGEFGMGAEIGIATGRMHARGPVGVEQLTSFKYRVRGDGQVRPLSAEPAPSDLRMPHAGRGMAIGLFGGSFNPPHEGHALVAEIALRRLRLGRLWWMVTPGNPLKSTRELLPLGERIARSRAIARDPRIVVTAFEKAFNVRYTADTLALVKSRNPGVDFVWIMGADGLRDFHRWQRWQAIALTFPIAVVDRPGSTLSFLSSTMAKTFDYARVDETDAPRLARLRAPAWTFIHGPRSSLSSTEIRRHGA